MRMRIQWLTISMLWACGISAFTSVQAAESVCYRAAEAHKCMNASQPKESCEAELTTDPYNLAARFSLCEVHLQNKAPLKAWIVLDHGLEICGRNRSACSRLQIARSNLEEMSEKQSRDTTALQRSRLKAQQESQRRVCLRRMKGDLSLNACNELLVAFPEDADLYTALGGKLVDRGSPAEALVQLRQASRFGGDQATLTAMIETAQAARAELAQRCLSESALDLCNRALLVGSDDEAALQLRRATLLAQADNTGAAIEALTIAQALDPNNNQLSQQLLELLPTGTLTESRYYLARGQAQRVLGDANAAIKDLKRALAMGAEATEVAAPLRAARLLREDQVQRECLQSSTTKPCEELLISGEPDEEAIRAHIASINGKAEQELAARKAEQERIASEARLAEQERIAARDRAAEKQRIAKQEQLAKQQRAVAATPAPRVQKPATLVADADSPANTRNSGATRSDSSQEPTTVAAPQTLARNREPLRKDRPTRQDRQVVVVYKNQASDQGITF